MTDTELRDIFRRGAHAPEGEVPVGRVPWWAVVLGYVVGVITVSIFTASIMAVLGDTFAEWSGGWSELAEMAMLLTGMLAVATLPFFAIGRALMAWCKTRFWVFYVVFWALGSFVLMSLAFSPDWFFQWEVWHVWLRVGAFPVLLGGTVQYLIERRCRRVP